MLIHHEGQTFHCKEVWKFKNRIPRAILAVYIYIYYMYTGTLDFPKYYDRCHSNLLETWRNH